MLLLENLLILGIVVYSIVLHEIGHAYAADYLGDRTARYKGRLTFKPLAHLDPFGSFLLPLVLILSGVPAFGYAKPVPYVPQNLKNLSRAPMQVMAAGPLTNISLALLFGLMVRVLLATGITSGVMIKVLGAATFVNVLLALFNLIPIPPLDGRLFIGLISPIHMFRAEMQVTRQIQRTIRTFQMGQWDTETIIRALAAVGLFYFVVNFVVFPLTLLVSSLITGLRF